MKSGIKILALVSTAMVFNSCGNGGDHVPQQTDTITTAGISDTLVKSSSDQAQEQACLYHGVDISKWNGNEAAEIDASDSLAFIICRATEGITITDPDFKKNWQTIREKGMLLGSYHFYICSDDAAKQAEIFWTTINNQGKTDLAPIVDIEELSHPEKAPSNTLEKNFKIFLNELEKYCGRTPIIYTDFSFANKYLHDPSFSEYPLWLAEYSGNKLPQIPDLWKTKGYKIWQKNASYTIDSHPTDYDVYKGSKSDLCK